MSLSFDLENLITIAFFAVSIILVIIIVSVLYSAFFPADNLLPDVKERVEFVVCGGYMNIRGAEGCPSSFEASNTYVFDAGKSAKSMLVFSNKNSSPQEHQICLVELNTGIHERIANFISPHSLLRGEATCTPVNLHGASFIGINNEQEPTPEYAIIYSDNIRFGSANQRFVFSLQYTPNPPTIAVLPLDERIDVPSRPAPEPLIEPEGDFLTEVFALSARLNVEPLYVLAVMHLETGGTFHPCQRNLAGSSATGLIQFTEATAQDLGTSTSELCAMGRTEQLSYVEEYLRRMQNAYGSLDTLEKMYLAVLCPVAIRSGIMTVDKDRYPNEERNYCGRDRNDNLVYIQNQGLDINQDGIITAYEAGARVRDRYENEIRPNAGTEDLLAQATQQKEPRTLA